MSGYTALTVNDALMSSTNPMFAQQTAGEAHIGSVGGQLVTVTATFTRPADTTAYAAGDAVNNSTSAPSLLTLTNAARVNGGGGYLVGVRLATNLKSITPRFRVRLFNDIYSSGTTPIVLSNDNAAFQSKYADEAKRVARLDLSAMITPVDTTNSDMSTSEDTTIRIPFVCQTGGRNLYATLEALDAFTPSSGESFTLTLVIDQN